MLSSATVEIHPSQFPERVRAELLESLRLRRINHKFHYDSVKQTMQWLALHQAYAPSRSDAECAAMYVRCFDDVLIRIPARRVHLVGLGCGGGQKDTRLIRGLRENNRDVYYTPLDVSAAMVLVARDAALQVIPPFRCLPFVCDLAIAEDLPEHLGQRSGAFGGEQGVTRLFTFFGMIPNFEPQVILPRLTKLIAPGDYLLFSANLAPGDDYATGVLRVLPLYDNALTREWLMTFLLDLGVERTDGESRITIEDIGELKRIAAYFQFNRSREVQVDTERFVFCAGDSIQLFFSYRHTPGLVRSLLGKHGLQVLEQWIAPSGEEGVFLVGRRGLT
jgi:L-histidine N-alpha-methyltransferase